MCNGEGRTAILGQTSHGFLGNAKEQATHRVYSMPSKIDCISPTHLHTPDIQYGHFLTKTLLGAVRAAANRKPRNSGICFYFFCQLNEQSIYPATYDLSRRGTDTAIS